MRDLPATNPDRKGFRVHLDANVLDDALMPALAVYADAKARRRRQIEIRDGEFGFLGHLLLNHPPRLVQSFESHGERSRLIP
jgi:hypothetical protein